MRDHPEIRTIVMAACWSVYVLETGLGVPEEISPILPRHTLVATDDMSIDGEVSFQTAINKTVGALRSLGREVDVIGAIPEMKLDVPTCVARQRLSVITGASCNLDPQVAWKRMEQVNGQIEQVANWLSATLIMLSDYLCDEIACRSESSTSDILYYDHNHLSTTGAKYLFQRLAKKKNAA